MKLLRGDMRSLDVDGSFAAGLCMFASLGYQLTNDDVEATLASVRAVLQPGAPFIFDVWNGLAVLRLTPEQRVKEVSDGGLRLLRIVRPELDAALHLCHDHYRLLVIDDGRILDEIDKTHSVRFFFPQEIAYFLDKAGFRVEHMSPFPDDGSPLDETVGIWLS